MIEQGESSPSHFRSPDPRIQLFIELYNIDATSAEDALQKIQERDPDFQRVGNSLSRAYSSTESARVQLEMLYGWRNPSRPY